MKKFLTKQQNFRLIQTEKKIADNKINLNENFVLGRIENIVRKGENAGYQHFLLSPECFPKPYVLGLLKAGIMCGGEIYTNITQRYFSVLLTFYQTIKGVQRPLERKLENIIFGSTFFICCNVFNSSKN